MKTKFLIITVVISFFLCSCGSSGDFRTADSTEVTITNEELLLAAELESREAAEQASREAEELASREAAEQASREAEELASKEAEEQASREAAEQASREAEEQASREAAEQASREAEEQASREAAEQASREAEELASREAAEQASREAEELASREAAERASREAAEQAPEAVVDVTESSTEAATPSYILNTKTKKIHYPSCRDVDKIKPENREDVAASLEELTNQGYSPCGHCMPQSAQAPEAVVDVTESSTEAATKSYVLNTKTKKIHYPSCKDVNKIKPENREDVEANLEELTNQGYSACGHCKPR